jgi:hypothetical protein
MNRNITIAFHKRTALTFSLCGVLGLALLLAGCSGVAKTAESFTPPAQDRSTVPANVDVIWPEGKGKGINAYYSKVAVAPTTKSRQVAFGGHYYQVVRYNVSSNKYAAIRPNWIACQNLAKAMTYNGLSGHLATITSQAENDFIKNTFGVSAIDKSDFVNGTNAGSGLVSPLRGLAIGGTLSTTDFTTITWTGKGGVTEPAPVAPAVPYANWAVQALGSEPTRSTAEWALQINSIGTGPVVNSEGWNNYDGSDSAQTFGYIVEFE